MMKFFNWLFSLFKKKNPPELTTKVSKNDDIEVSEIIGNDVTGYAIDFDNFLFKVVSDLEEQEEKAFSSEQLKKYFQNTFAEIQGKIYTHSDYCYITAYTIGVESKFLKTFFNIFEKVCTFRKIDVSLSGDMIRVDTSKIRKIVSSMKKHINVDEKAREVLRTGIYR